MKKLSKLFALGLALALTFGMTAFAAPSGGSNGSSNNDGTGSGNTGNPVFNAPQYWGEGEGIWGSEAIPGEWYYDYYEQVAFSETTRKAVEGKFGENVEVVEVWNVYNWTVAEGTHKVHMPYDAAQMPPYVKK